MTEPTDLPVADNPVASTSWRDSVSEENKNGVAKFESVDALAKSYGELERSMGGRVKIPTAESPAEERSAFYTKLGRPEKPEGYTAPTLPEGQELNKEFFGGMAAMAHEAGVSAPQFDKMAANYVAFEAKVREAEQVEFTRHREESDRKLHEDYGADYDANIELSKRAYTEYASDDLKEMLKTDKFIGIMNEPAFIDMLVNIGKKNMDDTFVKGDGQVEKPKDDYVPNSPNSPTMYANVDGEEGAKARAYFRAKGHVYSRSD